MPLFKKKISYDGSWVPAPQGEEDTMYGNRSAVETSPKSKNKKVFRVVTVWGRKQQEWLDSGMWQPQVETVVPAVLRAPMTVMRYGTYASDGMRHDGPPGGAYSSVFDEYAMQGGDLYTRDEARMLKQWDTRKPFPGFDPKLGSKTLDIYSED